MHAYMAVIVLWGSYFHLLGSIWKVNKLIPHLIVPNMIFEFSKYSNMQYRYTDLKRVVGTLKYIGLIFSIGSHLFKIITQIYMYEV
jgi:hypothetical protein